MTLSVGMPGRAVYAPCDTTVAYANTSNVGAAVADATASRAGPADFYASASSNDRTSRRAGVAEFVGHAAASTGDSFVRRLETAEFAEAVSYACATNADDPGGSAGLVEGVSRGSGKDEVGAGRGSQPEPDTVESLPGPFYPAPVSERRGDERPDFLSPQFEPLETAHLWFDTGGKPLHSLRSDPRPHLQFLCTYLS